jgi:diguanylate cyclase (GGDEF)-like protein
MHPQDSAFGVGLSLLVVDDDSMIRQLLNIVLTDLGFDVELLESLRAARERTAVRNFDIVIVDKNLPDGNGLSLCEELCAVDTDCKIVLMSGHADLASAARALQAEVADYLLKPLDLEDLRGRMSRVVERLKRARSTRRMIEELQRKNVELEGLTVRDPLTRLFNHGHLQDVLQREIARSQRYLHSFVLALLDVDGFRAINEQFGHAIGDRILREIAELLRSRSRKSDVPFRMAEEPLAARYGGDVFALILTETERGNAATKLESLRDAVRSLRFDLPSGPPLSLTVGLACYPQDGRERDVLLEAASRALRAGKRSGGDQLVSYSPELGTIEHPGGEHAQATAGAKALSRSLAQGSFKFLYQPIVRVRDSSLFAYEALCRPTDAGFRHVGELIETAVRTGRIRELGRVLRKIVVEPMDQVPLDCSLFVNIHPQDLGGDHKLESEAQLLPWAKRIVLEMTETEAIRDYDHARSRIQALRECGFRVALDDLGSGYSSLNLLARLEPDFVKLDMHLVRGLQQAGRTARLVQHLVEFCRGEGFVTVAEGIETHEELRAVSDLGVDLVQGFLLARPSPPFCGWAGLPPESIEPLLSPMPNLAPTSK